MRSWLRVDNLFKQNILVMMLTFCRYEWQAPSSRTAHVCLWIPTSSRYPLLIWNGYWSCPISHRMCHRSTLEVRSQHEDAIHCEFRVGSQPISWYKGMCIFVYFCKNSNICILTLEYILYYMKRIFVHFDISKNDKSQVTDTGYRVSVNDSHIFMHTSFSKHTTEN